MNSFQLPKTTNKINFIISYDDSQSCPFLSYSYYNSLLSHLDVINNIMQNNEIKNDISLEVMNQFLQVYSSSFSKAKTIVSRLPVYNATMYGFIEVIESFRCWNENTNVLYQGNNFTEFSLLNQHFKSSREEFHTPNKSKSKFDLVLCDTAKIKFSSHALYLEACCQLLETIMHYGSPNTTFILVLDHLFLKPAVEFLFILTSLFLKVTITKPTISNPTSFEKFIVCQGFLPSQDFQHFKENLRKIRTSKSLKSSVSFLSREVPIFFKNRIDEINVVLGQQQVESMCSFIALISSKNRDEKLENITKSNISKCIYWCEKFKVPFSRYGEKSNIFKEDCGSK